ncbi:MAG TPA: methyltransferase domain-containing protein [Thermoanaerobaculia bacterium]|nr:methyltransferase domain-containing protein [Thermoanaerobaculia bacterium]
MAGELPYRDFQFPLNVFMHVLTHEEGSVPYLHYGLFERPGEPIASAQERSTQLLFQRLPPPPAKVLDVGIGVGTTLARLAAAGYDVTGITPDEHQAHLVRATHGDHLRIEHVSFEDFAARPFDVVVFQESSQYIECNALFAKAHELTRDVIVLDEFSAEPTGTLHQLDEFLRAASAHGFEKTEEIDLSSQAAPTVDYFLERLPRYRASLSADLGLSDAQVDELIESGKRYRNLYRRGVYVYLLLRFHRR